MVPAKDYAKRECDWKICDLPRRLKNRHLDLGDVSPSDTLRFDECLKMDPEKVQAIQVDFFSTFFRQPLIRNMLKAPAMPHIIHQKFLHFNFSLKEIKNIKF